MTDEVKQPKPKRVVEYEGTLIGVVDRAGDKVKETRVYLREFKERWYIEVRRWVHLERYDGPDKRGVTCLVEEAAPIAALMLEAVEEYESRQTPTDMSSDTRQT